ncbi:MAG: DUF2384 domain-containing protein [Acidobacteriaceae bacterium]|nr:DUF2384 domain-containing protein [Acidobacteriaceae bacterium]MBV9309156.1 DUF2384 domain-containing protein [Acidobacteriaceae bacterium]MBV9677590.1 DUF2384 domain-containing protein [Acidobacteriaceae bacterium]
MGTRAKSGDKRTGSPRKGNAASFAVQKVSRGQMTKALSELGVLNPADASTVNRFVVIEVERSKSKNRISKVFRTQGQENSAAPLQGSARKAEIIAHATEALDGQVNAMRWLQKPNRSLSGKTPLDVLTKGKPEDAEQVDELLYGLEYGMYP